MDPRFHMQSERIATPDHQNAAFYYFIEIREMFLQIILKKSKGYAILCMRYIYYLFAVKKWLQTVNFPNHR